ncbi:MAG: 2-oxoacid:acceptor oxidoreductase family protein [Desulfovibrio sp.]|jgi:2-oxoglutarate ferredoxin oxidoreductase subunit gamma|nr:2-oxoacid:acceptor oxidoreductase family protein [Desulfovibrio sp.]
MERYRFLLSGSGGQGIITMAILLAETASIQEGLMSVQSQSYGPEARGGATRSDVIISDTPILFPKVTQPNILVALTNEATAKYLPLIRPGGLLLYDSELVQPNERIDAQMIGLPMYRITKEKLGRTVAFNICVLGALVSLTEIVGLPSVRKTLEKNFAPAHHEANKAALGLGVDLAKASFWNRY